MNPLFVFVLLSSVRLEVMYCVDVIFWLILVIHYHISCGMIFNKRLHEISFILLIEKCFELKFRWLRGFGVLLRRNAMEESYGE